MNNDLISRSALILEFCDCPDYSASMFKKIRRRINAAPAVDAVEVVRCGECEKRNKSADLTGSIYCRWLKCQMRKNDFCSHGERRTE